MEKQALVILVLGAILFAPAYAYYPWDDPVLDVTVTTPQKTAWMQHEMTLFIESCDDVQKVCHWKNRIGYVPITITIHEIHGDDRIFVDDYSTTTDKYGSIGYPIHINHKFKPYTQYEATITGSHSTTTDSELVTFWVNQKNY